MMTLTKNFISWRSSETLKLQRCEHIYISWITEYIPHVEPREQAAQKAEQLFLALDSDGDVSVTQVGDLENETACST
jgi:hypothetical protein